MWTWADALKLHASNSFEIAYQVFLAPFLAQCGLYLSLDPTWGRYLLPAVKYETELETQPHITARDRRVFISPTGQVLEGEDVKLVPSELEGVKHRQWIYYKVWESDESSGPRPAQGCDLVILHGFGDYGGKWIQRCEPLLRAGYRIIVPDLPSHGRSTGVHGHIGSSKQVADAIFATMVDTRRWSGKTPRKTHFFGVSFGGFSAISYCMHYGKDIPIDAVFLGCPLIGVATETDRPWIVKALGRLANSWAGRFPLLPTRSIDEAFGKGTQAAQEYRDDYRIYHGHLRISTGLALLDGCEAIQKYASSFSIPIRIIHGDIDTVTSCAQSVSFIKRAASKDKEVGLYPGMDHIMFKVGTDVPADATDRSVFEDRNDWLLKHVS
ncbi:hypothetical protein FRB99_008088 [Tulasnella sp. 403]|nr:hypothetical protein FRB99_008088 [Tulasnella sp. 403]